MFTCWLAEAPVAESGEQPLSTVAPDVPLSVLDVQEVMVSGDPPPLKTSRFTRSPISSGK